VAITLGNLAATAHQQGDTAEAIRLGSQALALIEKTAGPDDPEVAHETANLAAYYVAQERYAEAVPLAERAFEIRKRRLGPNHPDVASSLEQLGTLYYQEKEFRKAEQLWTTALSIASRTLGPDNPALSGYLFNLAILYQSIGDTAKALGFIRTVTAMYRERRAKSRGRTLGPVAAPEPSLRAALVLHLELLAAELERNEARMALIEESFRVAQLIRNSSTAAAVSQMAVRFTARDDDLARLLRSQQDTLRQWQSLSAALLEQVSKLPAAQDAQAEGGIRAQLDERRKQLDTLDAELAHDFPGYLELVDPPPIAIGDVQPLLHNDEALLTYVVAEHDTFLWSVTKDRSAFRRLRINRQEVTAAVVSLRRSLDPLQAARFAESPRGHSVVEQAFGARPFEVGLAQRLYQELLAPGASDVGNASHLLLVVDGPLESLPFSVLVLPGPVNDIRSDADYRTVPWLATKYAVTSLPGVSSLRALRQVPKQRRATRPFVGFGDPVLGGDTGTTQGVELNTLFRGGPVADVGRVRQLSRLPETAVELMEIARSLRADESDVFLGEAATESRVRAMDLTPYDVLMFATHGLVAGDLPNMTEPALVLTPPTEGQESDDGLLTSGEVAQLKLDADWVVLSACNTAASDGTPGAEGLSGLAKSFFYAGARSLLVSHWSVASQPAALLTIRMFQELKDHPDISRAEALRRSMLVLSNGTNGPPAFAHPMFWGPFVVVGEGGTASQP
jgi:CHAT domain-containing protein